MRSRSPNRRAISIASRNRSNARAGLPSRIAPIEIAADDAIDRRLFENAARSRHPAAALRDGPGHEQLEADAERTARCPLHIPLAKRLVMRALEQLDALGIVPEHMGTRREML
jgi:hypothetical protein